MLLSRLRRARDVSSLAFRRWRFRLAGHSAYGRSAPRCAPCGAGTGNPAKCDDPRWSNPPGCLCICPGRLRLKAQAHVISHVTSPGSRVHRGGIGHVPTFVFAWAKPLPTKLDRDGMSADREMMRQLVAVVRRLDEALAILDEMDRGDSDAAAFIERAVQRAKRALRTPSGCSPHLRSLGPSRPRRKRSSGGRDVMSRPGR